VKTVEPKPGTVNIIQGEDWRAPIIAYLRHHYEPDNNTKLLRMQYRDKANEVIGDELYKTSDTRPLLRCLRKAEGKELLLEVHSSMRRPHRF
jgi:hypothetical protein